MGQSDTTVAVYAEHDSAEAAIKTLTDTGFPMNTLSIVGKGFHTEEKAVGFYNVGDRIKFWGVRGAFWGAFWSLFFGGVFLTVPVIGQVVVLGYLGTTLIAAVESAFVIGGISALSAALFSIGIPKDSVIEYETALHADGFLVMAHGTADEMERAKRVLAQTSPLRINIHAGEPASMVADTLARSPAE